MLWKSGFSFLGGQRAQGKVSRSPLLDAGMGFSNSLFLPSYKKSILFCTSNNSASMSDSLPVRG